MNLAETKRSIRNSLNVDRRKVVIGGIALAGLGGAVYLGAKYLRQKQEAALAEASKTDIISPGWIETGIKTPFLHPQNGHIYFLHEAVTSNPLLTGLTKDYYDYLEQNRKEGRRLGFGEALSYALSLGFDAVKKTDKAKISEQADLPLEAIHIGLFAFAAGFMTRFKKGDLEKMGVSLDDYESSEDFFNGKEGIETVVFPKLFVMKELEGQNQFNGQDRAAHAAQYLFLMFELLYAKKYNLNLDGFSSAVLKLAARVVSGSLRRSEEETFLGGIGIISEVVDTFKPENLPLLGKKRREIDSGIFDLMVKADYKANIWGIRAGQRLFRALDSDDPRKGIESLIKRLNDPRFSRY